MDQRVEENKKVSIILPTHNGEKYIQQSIDSCLRQTCKNIELIIIDDASTDKTAGIIDRYNDSRIKVIRNENNLKLPNSLNKGFSLSSGDYLTWTSDDNYYDDNAINNMAEFLNEHENVDFVYSNYYTIDENGNVKGKVEAGKAGELDITNTIGACFLYRRAVYEKTGDYNPELPVAEDYEYWLRVRKRFSMKRLDDYLYYYRVHEETMSSRYGLDFRTKTMEDIRNRYISLSTRYYLEAEKLYKEKNHLNARRKFLKSLLLNPFNPHTLRMLALIYLPAFLVDKIRNIKRRF